MKNNLINTCLTTLFNPIVTFECIIPDKSKYQSYLEGTILLAGAFIARIASIYLTHAPLRSIDPLNANIFMEVAKILIPFFTWVISYYGVTSIMEGETTFDKIYVSSAYALTPYIVITVLTSIFSNIMSTSEAGFYDFAYTFMWWWMVFLYFCGLKIMNDYTLRKALKVFFVILFGMALIWAIGVLFYALTNNLWSFIYTLQREINIMRLERKW